MRAKGFLSIFTATLFFTIALEKSAHAEGFGCDITKCFCLEKVLADINDRQHADGEYAILRMEQCVHRQPDNSKPCLKEAERRARLAHAVASDSSKRVLDLYAKALAAAGLKKCRP